MSVWGRGGEMPGPGYSGSNTSSGTAASHASHRALSRYRGSDASRLQPTTA